MGLSKKQQEIVDFAVRMPESTVGVISGPAGAGKSYVIDAIDGQVGNMLKCAPSGRAAQNIGGQTIHRLFNLDAGLIYDPSWTYTSYRRFMFGKYGKMAGRFFNKKKAEILAMAQYIVVDECYNVSCHLIDAMDMIMRGVKKNPHVAFGGTRMLFFGDSGQLQAVVTRQDEKKLIALGYQAPFGLEQARVFNESES